MEKFQSTKAGEVAQIHETKTMNVFPLFKIITRIKGLEIKLYINWCWNSQEAPSTYKGCTIFQTGL